jgi:hypothetical protein
VWPEPDVQEWLLDGVREVRWDERADIAHRVARGRGSAEVTAEDGSTYHLATVPALVCEHDGVQAGVAAFRPYPDGRTEVLLMQALVDGSLAVERELRAGIEELDRRRRLWTTP